MSFSFSNGSTITRRQPDVRAVVIENSGHLVAEEQPEAVADATKFQPPFLRVISPASPYRLDRASIDELSDSGVRSTAFGRTTERAFATHG
jgi:hypothetical protein